MQSFPLPNSLPIDHSEVISVTTRNVKIFSLCKMYQNVLRETISPTPLRIGKNGTTSSFSYQMNERYE